MLFFARKFFIGRTHSRHNGLLDDSKWIREQNSVELVRSDIYRGQIPVHECLESEVGRQIPAL